MFFFDTIISFTTHFAKLVNLANLGDLSIDGSPIKSANNTFNVIHKDEIQLLFIHYKGHIISNDDLKSLCHLAKKIMNHENLSHLKKFKYWKTYWIDLIKLMLILYILTI